ncbi:unnamed protein product [Boreogadus saida]
MILELEMKKLFLFTGKVKHSQNLSVTPTHPWITVQEDGTVLMAHCTCLHGEALCLGSDKPSDKDCQLFFEALHNSELRESKPKKSAILSVIEGHSQRYIPKVMQLDLPTPLSTLYSSTQLEMEFSLLLVESTKVFDDLTKQQCLIVEEETREQREDGVMALRHIHKYMFQVQAQMHIAEVSYCDFLVWTPQEVFTQRILYDPLFFHDAYGKVTPQPQNSHMKRDATAVNLQAQMS